MNKSSHIHIVLVCASAALFCVCFGFTLFYALSNEPEPECHSGVYTKNGICIEQKEYRLPLMEIDREGLK
jgi:hypothetical protein